MTSPNINYKCMNAVDETSNVIFPYVPSHLYHILFELMKNSLRAVVEKHQDSTYLPDINVIIVKGKEDVTIKISDQGGGVSYQTKDKLFRYMYSTAPQPSPSTASLTPLAGYGYGLPLSRLYAKYFNGDLVLSSVEGYGTDVFVYLKVLASEASETLPVYNKTTYDKYKQSMSVADWSDNSPLTSFNQGRLYSTYCSSVFKKRLLLLGKQT